MRLSKKIYIVAAAVLVLGVATGGSLAFKSTNKEEPVQAAVEEKIDMDKDEAIVEGAAPEEAIEEAVEPVEEKEPTPPEQDEPNTIEQAMIDAGISEPDWRYAHASTRGPDPCGTTLPSNPTYEEYVSLLKTCAVYVNDKFGGSWEQAYRFFAQNGYL